MPNGVTQKISGVCESIVQSEGKVAQLRQVVGFTVSIYLVGAKRALLFTATTAVSTKANETKSIFFFIRNNFGLRLRYRLLCMVFGFPLTFIDKK